MAPILSGPRPSRPTPLCVPTHRGVGTRFNGSRKGWDMGGFIIGLLVGGFVGMVVLALCAVSRDADKRTHDMGVTQATERTSE